MVFCALNPREPRCYPQVVHLSDLSRNSKSVNARPRPVLSRMRIDQAPR
jgi:hypothetical protein